MKPPEESARWQENKDIEHKDFVYLHKDGSFSNEP